MDCMIENEGGCRRIENEGGCRKTNREEQRGTQKNR